MSYKTIATKAHTHNSRHLGTNSMNLSFILHIKNVLVIIWSITGTVFMEHLDDALNHMV